MVSQISVKGNLVENIIMFKYVENHEMEDGGDRFDFLRENYHMTTDISNTFQPATCNSEI